MKGQQPQWQPISMLLVFTDMVDGMLESAFESLATLRECANKPSVLDDEILNRYIALHSEQRDDHWLYEEQFARWKRGTLTDGEATEVNRLIDQSTILKATNEKIVALAEKIAPYTIDKILAVNPADLGRRTLSGEIKHPAHDAALPLTSPDTRRLVERIDKKVAEIVTKGGDDLDVLAGMADDMAEFKKLIDTTSSEDMSRLCGHYNGFYCYTQVLENIAQGIASGDIRVP